MIGQSRRRPPLAAFGWAIAALRAIGVLVSVWVLPAPAITQEIIVERASFGYAGVVQAEKQTFLRLWISSGNTPWSGQISVDAPHDNTQDGSVVVAAATTPGIAVPVEIPLLLASNWRKITIRATDGARVETWELDRFDEDGEGPIVSPRMDSSSRAFLAVGDVSAIRYFAVRGPDGRFTYQTNLSETEPEVTEGSEPTPPEPPSPQWGPNHEMDPESSWDRTPFEVAEGGLPVHWQCLEAYSLVVATESGLRAEQPQARSALMEWVLAGGRLLIMLDPGGEGWRGLAHPDFPINAFEAADATTSVPEASIVQIANSGRKTQIELRARPARVLKLTESGRREGWRASWPFEGASENEGCLVTGPYGFGMIGFLGVDPGDLPSLAGRFPGDAANRLWRDVIQRTAWAGRLDGILTEPSDNWWWYPASGSSSTARESLRRVLDDISIVAPLGNGLFFVLAAAMLLMAVMIGPGDAILLKKLRLRHRSWLTALGWIGVATTIAALAPSMVRTGNHAYTMMATDDVRMLPNGDAIVARTGTLGIFGGRPGWLPLPTHAQGTAWRGVSPSNHHGSGFKTTVPIRMVSREFQSLGCRGTEVIGRGPNDEKSIRVAQWTFRTLQSQEPCGYAGEDTITARIKRDSFGVVVTLDGLPADGVIADSRLEIGGQYYRVTFSQPSGRTALSESVEPIDAAKASFRPKPDAPRSQPLPVMPGLVTHPVSEAFSLQGAGDRADAVAAQVQSGNYGCLYLKVTSSTIPGVPAKQGLITSRWLMARIVAPIEGATP